MDDAGADASGGAHAVRGLLPAVEKIYVFGGEDGSLGTNYALTRIYDIASNVWSTGADMPDVRSFMASAYNPGRPEDLPRRRLQHRLGVEREAQVWVYDPVSNTFDASRAPIPHAVGGTAFGLLNDVLYMAGGRDAENHVINDAWAYNIGSNSWSVVAPLPH